MIKKKNKWVIKTNLKIIIAKYNDNNPFDNNNLNNLESNNKFQIMKFRK